MRIIDAGVVRLPREVELAALGILILVEIQRQ